MNYVRDLRERSQVYPRYDKRFTSSKITHEICPSLDEYAGGQEPSGKAYMFLILRTKFVLDPREGFKGRSPAVSHP